MTHNPNYYAGMDCTCSAYGESECGCGVDWTDSRIYKLESRIKILEETILKLEAEVANLKPTPARDDY